MIDTAQPELLLTKQTFVCLTSGTLVFLDLHRDKYSCLERKYTNPIATLLGLPVSSMADQTNVGTLTDQNRVDIEKTVRTLIASGLVTKDPERGKRAAFVPEHRELREMLGYIPGEGPKVQAQHVFNFFKALIVTKSLLRIGSMERTVTRVKRRRDRYYASGGAEPDYERVNELVETYKILKPLFVTVKDECLFNSLFLIEFLACYRVYPSWYFGVRLNEFYAHCWVQGGDVIYDDFIQSTSENQPIMVV